MLTEFFHIVQLIRKTNICNASNAETFISFNKICLLSTINVYHSHLLAFVFFSMAFQLMLLVITFFKVLQSHQL